VPEGEQESRSSVRRRRRGKEGRAQRPLPESERCFLETGNRTGRLGHRAASL
jgi:hypothetical protein